MDLIQHKIDRDTKNPILRCFAFFSKLKAGDIMTKGQHMNFQTFSNLQFRPLRKIFFIVLALTWKTRAMKIYPLYL